MNNNLFKVCSIIVSGVCLTASFAKLYHTGKVACAIELMNEINNQLKDNNLSISSVTVPTPLKQILHGKQPIEVILEKNE